MKFVITGHTSGIGKAIFENYGGVGLSKSTGFNIITDDIVPYLDSETIFINNAFTLTQPFSQIRLLYDSVKICRKVICIGSNTRIEGIYKTTKDALNIACQDLFYNGYNVTNIRLGKVDTPYQQNYYGKKISINTVIKTIDFILSINERINEISIRPEN